MEPFWEEIQRCLIDAVRELSRVIEQLQILVDNRCSKSLAAVSNSGQRGDASYHWSTERTPSKCPSELTSPNPRAIGERERNVASIANEGEFWTLRWDQKAVRLKNSKGVRLLAVLIDNPGREFHVADLESHERKSESDGLPGLLASSDAGPILDDSARSSYAARLRELREELDEAQHFNDLFRASKIQDEITILTRELARAFGLNGESRLAISNSERARVRVTLAVKSAIGKISTFNSSVGWHLATSIKTGVFCLYMPAPIARDGNSVQRTEI